MGLFSSILGTATTAFTGQPWLGSAISAGGSLLGGMQQNSAAQNAAQAQMEFQRDMSGTSYQRAVADLKAAGLNPALAYANGGASTPGGASYVPQDVVTPAINSALSTRKLQGEMDLLKTQQDKLKADSLASISQAGLNSALSRKSDAETRSVLSSLPHKELMGKGWGVVSDWLEPVVGGNGLLKPPPSLSSSVKQMVKPDSSAFGLLRSGYARAVKFGRSLPGPDDFDMRGNRVK